MRRLIGMMVSAVALLVCTAEVHAQDLLVPAGTLLQCTLDEPNFSSKTAAVGDPVLCHLRTQQEFGRPLFPRGSMLGGHLEEAKDPGHFVGKGYLKITFDRVILPNGDLPVPAKVIQARGFKVDKQGAIDGKGHATRDVVEWMIPPLWPWKVVSLPMRGPTPTLKGEEPMQLRLMDDIVIPQHVAQVMHPDRSPSAIIMRPSSYAAPAPHANPAPAPVQAPEQKIPPAPPVDGSMHLAVDKAEKPVVQIEDIPAENQTVEAPQASERYTMLVRKSNQVIEAAKFHREGDYLVIQDTQGRIGSLPAQDVDWLKTSQMTAEVQSVDSAALSRATH
ncbi:MAG TPA: hypothetical protein VMH89_07575 [Candidatus Acidoferrum sp.]|nr:hypothetical protein [Candidatus Acidoferrum sp.]